MADFGLYASLKASPNFDVRRQDAAANLVLATRMRDDAVAQMQERMKSIGAISQSLNKAADLENDLLPNDAARVKALDMKLRKDILEGLQQFNNDPVMFRMSGGDETLSKYERDLKSSPELRSGMENKKNYLLGVGAIQKGEEIDDVEVEFDGGTKQKMSWVDAFDLYNQDVIKKLPFKGSYAVPKDVDPLDFMRFEIPDAEMKYKGNVSKEYFNQYAQAKYGLTHERAEKEAKRFGNPNDPKTTIFTWGRRLPHSSGGGGQQNYNDKLVLAKNAVDVLHRALFDPSYRADYNAAANGYALTNSPIDLSKIKESSDAHANSANGLYVRNDPNDPSKSVFIITFEGGGKKEMTVDDILKTYPPPGLQTDDVTRINDYVNRDGSALYNPTKWQATMPQGTPFSGSVEEGGTEGAELSGMPQWMIDALPKGTKTLKNTAKRKDFNYGEKTTGAKVTVQTDAAAIILDDYDITTYATAPNHEAAVQSAYKKFSDEYSDDMEAGIKAIAPNSPISAEMIQTSADKFNVNPAAVAAIIMVDSTFGTKGKAVRTKNAGNVGNMDDGSTKEFESWEAGVDAVAKWLSKHKKQGQQTPVAPTQLQTIPGW